MDFIHLFFIIREYLFKIVPLRLRRWRVLCLVFVLYEKAQYLIFHDEALHVPLVALAFKKYAFFIFDKIINLFSHAQMVEGLLKALPER